MGNITGSGPSKIFTEKKNDEQYIVGVISFNHPTCKAHLPYFIVLSIASACTRFIHLMS
jgi:hypothetical protein